AARDDRAFRNLRLSPSSNRASRAVLRADGSAAQGPKVCRLFAWIRTSGTAHDAPLLADLYAHNVETDPAKREFGSDSCLFAPPWGGRRGLGGRHCFPFPTLGDG